MQDARALATIAIADRLADHGNAILSGIVQQWWRGEVLKRIAAGKPVAPREHLYWLFEMMHAIRRQPQGGAARGQSEIFQDSADRRSRWTLSAATADGGETNRVPIYVREAS